MTARSELDQARPVLAQMDVTRGPDKAKADLMVVWSAVEAALRSLVGGSATGGQALIRDARSRQLLTFDQANALVAFHAVREQLDRADYVPTEADANTARNAFLKLDAGLMSAAAMPTGGPLGAAPMATPSAAPSRGPTFAAAGPAPTAPAASDAVPVRRRRFPAWLAALIAVVVVGGVVLAFLLIPRGSKNAALDDGIRAYTAGDKPTAAMKFEQAARNQPNSALPHVYLSRMAREVGNYTVANQELQTALRVEPRSLEARREYGSLFLAQGNYDMARTFYVRALEVDPTDKPSQGWLGCAMMRLNRAQEGRQWLGRAGPGPWSSCANLAAPTAPGASPP